MFTQENENLFDTEDIPNDCICPITQDLMEDPVVAADGYSYERSAIAEWLRRGGKNSPVTGAKLAHTKLVPNHRLKSIINDFKEKSPEIKQKKLDLDRRLQQLEQQITDLKQQPKYYVATQDYLSYQSLPPESKNSEFLSAAIHGEIGRLVGLFKAGANIETFREKDQRTALHLAAFYNQKHAVEYLLTERANTKACDKYGQTPLILVAKKAYHNIVEQLSRNYPDDVNITDNKGKTALFYAVNCNKKTTCETIQILLNAGADYGVDPCWKDCLDIAIKENKREILQLLLAKHMEFFHDDIIGKKTKEFQALFAQLRSSIDAQNLSSLTNTLEQFVQVRTFFQENILNQAKERISLLSSLADTHLSLIQPLLTQAETVQQNLFLWWEKTLYEEHCQQFNDLLLLAASSSSAVFEQLFNFIRSVYGTILTNVQLQNLLCAAIKSAVENNQDGVVKLLIDQELKSSVDGKTGSQERSSYYLLKKAATQYDFDTMNMILRVYGYSDVDHITDIEAKFHDMDSIGIQAINDAILEKHFIHFQMQQRDILRSRRYKLNRLLINSLEVQEEQTAVYLLKRGADPREALEYAKVNELNDFISLLNEWKQDLGQEEIIKKLTSDSDFKEIFSLCPHSGEIVIEKKLHELNLRISDVDDVQKILTEMLQRAIEIKASDNIFRIQMTIEFVTELEKYLKGKQQIVISSSHQHRKDKLPIKSTYSDISHRLRVGSSTRRRSTTLTSSSSSIASIKQEVRADKKYLEKISKAIKDRNIEKLKVLLVKITCLDLSGYMIGSAGAEVLAEVLKDNSSLITVNLTTNRIETKGVCSILKSLNANRSSALTSINLANNPLNSNIQEFATLLGMNRKLNYINLTDTKIDDNSAGAIANVIERNTILNLLLLNYNQITDYGARIIASALNKNNTLISLELSGNRISTDFIKLTINPLLKRNKSFTTEPYLQNYETASPSAPPLEYYL